MEPGYSWGLCISQGSCLICRAVEFPSATGPGSRLSERLTSRGHQAMSSANCVGRGAGCCSGLPSRFWAARRNLPNNPLGPPPAQGYHQLLQLQELPFHFLLVLRQPVLRQPLMSSSSSRWRSFCPALLFWSRAVMCYAPMAPVSADS